MIFLFCFVVFFFCFHVKAALLCPGSVRRCATRMYKTERPLKSKVAESCLHYKNNNQEAVVTNRVLWP